MKGDSIWPVRCSSGVPAVMASTIAPAALPQPVPVLVTHTPSVPLTRAYASAMLQAPASPRAETKRIFWRVWNASRMGMLWIEITPKAARTPHCSRKRAASSPTVMRCVEGLMRLSFRSVWFASHRGWASG